MTRQLISLLASDVDFQARLNPTDRLEVFFSQPDGDDQMSEDSELLYVARPSAARRATSTASSCRTARVDYFDEDGRSAKQFLLRNAGAQPASSAPVSAPASIRSSAM